MNPEKALPLEGEGRGSGNTSAGREDSYNHHRPPSTAAGRGQGLGMSARSSYEEVNTVVLVGISCCRLTTTGVRAGVVSARRGGKKEEASMFVLEAGRGGDLRLET